MNIKEKIGARIKELRNKEGISQEVFADMSRLDRTYIKSVENGKRNISFENSERIINALDLSVQEFLNEKK